MTANCLKKRSISIRVFGSTAYSSNVFDIIEGNAFIKAGSVSGGVTCVSRIVASCDF
jgi:hypothetical protein